MPRLGLLTMTHGVPARPNPLENPANILLQQQVRSLNFPVPHAHGFMQIPAMLQPAVDELTAQGCDLICGVFLYPSATNNEIQNTRAELGFGPPPEGYYFPYNPVKTTARIVLSKPMQAHPLIADVLTDRLLAVSQNPNDEVAVIVSHGEYHYPSRILHERALAATARLIENRDLFRAVHWTVQHPEDDTARTVSELRERYSGARLVVCHNYVEKAYFVTEWIPKALAHLPEGSYAYNPDTLFPHPAWREYILFRMAEALRDNGLGAFVPDEARALGCREMQCQHANNPYLSSSERAMGCLAHEFSCHWPRHYQRS